MLKEEIKEGTIIEGPYWEEPVVVEKINKTQNYTQIIVKTLYSHKYMSHLLLEEDL